MKNQKSLTNKGFSLVELIIVVAIMAVLIGVLAPQYLRYVERTRLQRDNTSMGELANVIKMATAEQSVIEQLATGDLEIKFKNDGTVDPASTALGGALGDEIKATMDTADIELSSNTYLVDAPTNVPKLTVSINGTTNQIEVTADKWKDKPTDGSYVPKKF